MGPQNSDHLSDQAKGSHLRGGLTCEMTILYAHFSMEEHSGLSKSGRIGEVVGLVRWSDW